MIDCEVVFVADRRTGTAIPTLECADFELVETEYFEEVVGALDKVVRGWRHYPSPACFVDNIGQHRNDVVLPLWAGQRSRSRKALLPAICEAYDVAYIGADAYTNAISQDKHIAKSVLRAFGFSVPRGILIRNDHDLELLQTVRYPAVVKPNFEGGSIGISRDCLVSDVNTANLMVRRVHHAHKQPVVVEEFIAGREISLVMAGRHEPSFAEAVELHIGSTSLRETIWSLELKQSDEAINWTLATSEIKPADWTRARRLFSELGKTELLRIDGRLGDGGFVATEISPDVHLGTTGCVAEAFRLVGISFADMFERLITNALDSFSAARNRPK